MVINIGKLQIRSVLGAKNIPLTLNVKGRRMYLQDVYTSVSEAHKKKYRGEKILPIKYKGKKKKNKLNNKKVFVVYDKYMGRDNTGDRIERIKRGDRDIYKQIYGRLGYVRGIKY